MPPYHGGVEIETWQGDITTMDVDAIVNTANSALGDPDANAGWIPEWGAVPMPDRLRDLLSFPSLDFDCRLFLTSLNRMRCSAARLYSGSNTTNYVYGPTGQPIEEILPSGSGYYYSQDALGSTRALTNSPGTATDTDTYDPYGNLTASTGTVQDNLLYAAQYLDAESGLYYLRARYYDTATGQFLTVDPQVATTLEPYAYVSSDPENGVDPTGKNVVPISSIGLNLNAGKPGWNLGYGAHCANPVYSGGGQMPCSDASTIGRACEAKGGSVHAKLSCEGSIYYAAYLSAFDWLQAREFANTWYWSLFHTFYFPYNIATYMQGQEYFGLQGDIYVDNLEVRQWQATGEQGSQQDIYDEGTDNCADGGGYFTCPGLHADRYWADFDFASAT